VILTPHIGGSTEEAQKNIAQYVPDKLNEFINKGNTFGSVNFPNPPVARTHRGAPLHHIHRNVPGVLAQINSILARHDINILGQYLKTNNPAWAT
jgi:D-3-phosphoglycerate dehydrogenase